MRRKAERMPAAHNCTERRQDTELHEIASQLLKPNLGRVKFRAVEFKAFATLDGFQRCRRGLIQFTLMHKYGRQIIELAERVRMKVAKQLPACCGCFTGKAFSSMVFAAFRVDLAQSPDRM